MTPELTLGWVHSKTMGYGRYGSYLAETLTSLGVDVHADFEQETAPTNVVCWVSVPTHAQGWWSGQIPTISTMWESSRLPEGFRDTIHEFDTIIVPSWHNVELFSKFHPNVKFVPLGIDPERWHYVPRQAPGRDFRFLIGGSGSRKGLDLAVRAFKAVFATWPKDGPVPRLILKAPRGDTEVNGVSTFGDRIEIVSGKLDADAEVALYEGAHCYLQPSRGEGFGLQPLQAIAQGIPTILTNAHGHESFAHLGLGIGSKMSTADYFVFGDAGEWWEPSLEDLCEQMWAVYNDYAAHEAKAFDSARVVAAHWTWERTGHQFLDALGRDR
jgi:glycosyltransferase involved in cell wall biosynthesis